MMRRKRKQEQKSGAPRWMVTFSDLVTLVLVFFILLFSMSQIDLKKFEAVAQSFREGGLAFNGYPSVIVNPKPSEEPKITPRDRIEQGREDRKGGKDEEDFLQQLMTEINEFLQDNGLTEVISANREERGVVLVLQERVLFNSGDANLLPSADSFLTKVGTLLENIPNPIKVEGHTDNRPISTYRFPSNWELSTARAASVVRYLESNFNLDKNRFIVVGYGETRPVVENSSPENWQKNRRVEIVITDPDYVEDSNSDNEEEKEAD